MLLMVLTSNMKVKGTKKKIYHLNIILIWSKNLRVHSRNKVIDYETQYGEWKTELIISINFI